MLTGKSVLFVGGDARHLEMMEQLILADADVYAIGFEGAKDQLSDVNFIHAEQVYKQELSAVVLPITGLDQDGYAEAHYAEESPHLTKDWFNELPDDCFLFTGIMTPYLKELEAFKGMIVPLFERDDVAIYNSIPTAEGTLMLAIQYTDFTIHDSNIMILGFGRVGKTLVHSFKGLGANVSVSSRSTIDLARIFEYNCKPIPLEQLDVNLQDCNLLINTIPDVVVTPTIIRALPENSMIIDLASKPGGVDCRYSKRIGVKEIQAQGLPGIVAPKSAGKILAHVVHHILNEEE